MTAPGLDLEATVPNGEPRHEAWRDGPPPGRFDDADAARPPTPAPWEPLVTPAPAEWYTTQPPRRTWLLRDVRHAKRRGVLPLGKVGQLIAEGGAGKTMALCQLAVATATGTTWLGTFEAAKGPVLLVLGEEDAEEARRRLHHAANASRGPRPDPGAIVILPLAGVPCAMLEHDDRNTVETLFLDWLRGYVKAGAFRLVVVDPLSRFAGPDAEKDNAVATRFMQALESLAAPDRAILNAHHVNKMSRGPARTLDGSSGRGSTAFVDGARWQGGLSVEYPKLDVAEERERLGQVVTFSVTKSNYARKPDPVVLRHDADHGGALVPLDDTDLAIVEAARSGVGKRAAKMAQRENERENARTDRERKEAERRITRKVELEEATRQRNADDDAAARDLIAANPDMAIRRLKALVMKARACGSDRALDAIHRVRPTPTPKNLDPDPDQDGP